MLLEPDTDPARTKPGLLPILLNFRGRVVATHVAYTCLSKTYSVNQNLSRLLRLPNE